MLGVSPVLALRTVDFPPPPPLSTGTEWNSRSAVSWTKPRSCSGTHGHRGLVVDDEADDEPFAEGAQVAVDGPDGRVGVDAALPPRSSSPWRSVQDQSRAASSASPPRGLSAWSGVSLPPAGEQRPPEAGSAAAAECRCGRSGDGHRPPRTSPVVAGEDLLNSKRGEKRWASRNELQA